MMKIYKKIAFFILFVFLVVCVDAIKNQTCAVRFDQLPKTEQDMLKEVDALFASKSPWKDFNFSRRPLLLERKGDILSSEKNGFNILRGYTYAFNIKGLEGKYYAKRIQTPIEYRLPYVYRLAVLSPIPLEAWNPVDNFTGIQKVESAKNVFLFKYNRSTLYSNPKSSTQFSAFLPHEAFHFFVQHGWGREAGRGTHSNTPKDYYLTGLQYEILDRMNSAGDENKLKKMARDYVTVTEQRLMESKNAVQASQETETVEGTANYFSLKYSKMIYRQRFKPLYKIRRDKDRKFMTAFRLISEKLILKNEINDGMLYDTGASLCLAMDRLKVPKWQERLNLQGRNHQVTLYSELKEFICSNATKKVRSMEGIKEKYDPNGEILKMAEKFKNMA